MNNNTKKLFTLFLTFFKIGLFTFGGGFAMIPLMKKELVDNHGWIEEDKFIDSISITQSVPGAVAVNLAIFFGYNMSGVVGALVAAFAVALPSFIIILLIAIGFDKFSQYMIVKNIFKGIRPAVVGLITYACIDLARNVNWSSPLITTIIIVIISGIILSINPICLILMAIAVGSIVHKRSCKKQKVKKIMVKDMQIR